VGFPNRGSPADNRLADRQQITGWVSRTARVRAPATAAYERGSSGWPVETLVNRQTLSPGDGDRARGSRALAAGLPDGEQESVIARSERGEVDVEKPARDSFIVARSFGPTDLARAWRRGQPQETTDSLEETRHSTLRS
jgi:hypothetical protein